MKGDRTMLNIIAINSSKRKINTYKIIFEVKEILNNEEINVEIINLFDYNIESCIGCEICINKDKCIFDDDVFKLMNKMKSSDGIILTSPVYMENISGKLKVLLDRTCKWFHRPELYGKPILVVATTKGSGLKYTLDYLDKVVIQWGGMNSGSIGRNIRNIDKKVVKDECKEFIDHIKMDKKFFKPSLKALIHFQTQKVLAKKIGCLDSDYWNDKAWTKELYYFKCNIILYKRLIATGFGSFLDKVINK